MDTIVQGLKVSATGTHVGAVSFGKDNLNDSIARTVTHCAIMRISCEIRVALWPDLCQYKPEFTSNQITTALFQANL